MSDVSPIAESVEDNFFDFECPYCGEPVSFPPSSIGEAGECTSCGETFIVPPAGSEKGVQLPLPRVTARLTLRRFQLSDIDDITEFMSEAELPEYAGTDPMDEQQVSEWIASDARVRLTTPDQHFYLAIERNDERRIIGFVRLGVEQVSRKVAVISLLVARQHQRQGFGTEALRAALDFCFAIRLHRVAASFDRRNEAAARTCEKAGMKFEAQFREDRADGFGWADTVWFGMIERDRGGSANAIA